MESQTSLDISARVNALLGLAKASGVVCVPLDPTPFRELSALKDRVRNDTDVATLVSSIDEYSRTVWIFVNGISIDHLRSVEDAEIRLARDGIAGWHFQLEQALQLIKEASLHEKNPSFFQKAQRRKTARRCIDEINSAHERFENAVADLVTPFPILATSDCPPVSPSTPSSSFSSPSTAASKHVASGLQDGSIRSDELKIVRILPPTSECRESFWNDFVEADVRGQAKLVKIYRRSAEYGDGETEFLEDVHNLRRRTFGSARFPRVLGYCNDDLATFVVFDSMCFTPFKHAIFLLQKTGQSIASQTLWRQFMEMFNAVQYLVDSHQGVTWTFLEAILSDARVDDRGTVVVSPRWVKMDLSGWDTSRAKFLMLLQRLRQNFFEGSIELRTFKSLFYPYRNRWERRMHGAVTTGLPDSSAVLNRLPQYCPSDYQGTELRWPLGATTSDGSVPRAGDIGYFEEGETDLPGIAGSSFKVLGNLAKDCLGGVNLQMTQYESLFGTTYATIERVTATLFRLTITPPNNVLECEPGLAFQTLEVEWHTSITGCDIHPQALRGQAQELSSYRNLSGTTLCLTTGLQGLISFGTIGNFICRIIDPVHLFVEFDELGLLLSARWSFSGDPSSKKGFIEAEKFGCPQLTVYHPPSWSRVTYRSLGKMA